MYVITKKNFVIEKLGDKFLKKLIDSVDDKKIFSKKSLMASERYSQNKMIFKTRKLYEIIVDS